MADFTLPELGENVDVGDVTKVLVKVGDTIEHEQPVLELETDKATIEVPSGVAGTITSIAVKSGDKVKVGAVVLSVDAAEPTAGNGRPAASAPSATPIVVEPNEAPAVDARRQERKVVAMTPRHVEPPPAPVAVQEVGDRAPASAASPAVRRLAREVGIDVDGVQGSGPGGRITQDDVKAEARRLVSHGGVASSPGRPSGAPSLPDFEKWGQVERQPMSNIRRTTSERLGHAWNAIPHVTQCDKADITAMEELRKKYREQVTNAGGNFTVTAMLVKVLATAVQHFPQFNASLDVARGELVYKKYVNVGVAVDTDRGLLVPVVRDADQKNIMEIAVEVHQAAERARAKKLTLEDMSGGGITISNLGGIGGTYFTPIVNWPEVAILGVSRGIIEPAWRDGAFQPRQLLPLSLSYDHRVIDGADATRFLRWVAEAIEQPFLLSLLG